MLSDSRCLSVAVLQADWSWVGSHQPGRLRQSADDHDCSMLKSKNCLTVFQVYILRIHPLSLNLQVVASQSWSQVIMCSGLTGRPSITGQTNGTHPLRTICSHQLISREYVERPSVFEKTSQMCIIPYFRRLGAHSAMHKKTSTFTKEGREKNQIGNGCKNKAAGMTCVPAHTLGYVKWQLVNYSDK